MVCGLLCGSAASPDIFCTLCLVSLALCAGVCLVCVLLPHANRELAGGGGGGHDIAFAFINNIVYGMYFAIAVVNRELAGAGGGRAGELFTRYCY